MNWKITIGAIAASVMLGAGSSASANPSEPTCSDTLGIEVHGQHVIADYVTGLHGDLDWPPSGQAVGESVQENGGAVLPGGPGPGFHFPNDFAPGASFCTDSQSPGTHL